MATRAPVQTADGQKPMAAGGGTRLPVTAAVATVLAFAASYTAGLLGHATVIGTGQVAPAVWPISALVLTALVLSRPRAWPPYVFGALVATVAVDGRPGWTPVTFAVTGMVECLVAAVVIRQVLGRPPHLDRLRDGVLYLVAAAGLAPLAAVSAGAGVMVAAGLAPEFFGIWSGWLISGALTHATLTAPLLAWLAAPPTSAAPPARRLELGLLAVGLVAVSLFALHRAGPAGGGFPDALSLLLPFLLWAAMRLRAQGATGAVGLVTVIAILGAATGRGPFASPAPADAVLHLQLFLLAVAVPTLLLAAVMAERRDAAAALRETESRPSGTGVVSVIDTHGRPGNEVEPTASRARGGDGLSTGELAAVGEVTARRAGEDATRSAQRLLQSTMDALSASIAILDERGTVIAVNEPWRRCAGRSGLPAPGADADYASLCDGVQGAMAAEAAQVASAIRDMLRGGRADFRLEYRFDAGGQRRWFRLRVSRCSDAGGFRIVLAHEDITDLKQAEGGLRDLTGRLLRLQDEERRRTARELHDGAGQNLVALSMNLARLERLVRGDERTGGIVADSLALVEQSLQEMRTLSYVLYPPTLDGVGLASAIRWYVEGFAKRSGIGVRLDLPPDTVRLPQEVESALFRVIQESLINVHRHSGSGTAAIRLRREAGAVRLEVMDEGAGFGHVLPEPGDGQGSFGGGIPGMRERLRQLGGRLDIRSDTRGTTVTAVAPLLVESDAAHLAG